MRRRGWIKPDTQSEVELDLAPLLAVMVKLVPVLLISSAFVQMMVIETELPQAVQEAIAQNNQNPETTLTVEASMSAGFVIRVGDAKGEREVKVPAAKDGALDFPALHAELVRIKSEHPGVFRLGLAPAGDVSYGDLVRVMDEARRARDPKVTFPLQNPTGDEKTSPYMFPDVVFVNTLGEGA